MLKSIAIFSISFSLAFLILIVSIFRIAQIKYVFSQSPSPTPTSSNTPTINYNLPYPGKIQEDSVLWPLKALRDKIWLTVTINPSKKAELYLLMADKRLADSKSLFDKGSPDLGVAVLTKAEKYLEMAHLAERAAHQKNMNTTDCLEKYTLATLKHRQVIDEILAIAPEDAKPLIVKTQDYPKNLYNEAKNGLFEAGLPAPQNPFN